MARKQPRATAESVRRSARLAEPRPDDNQQLIDQQLQLTSRPFVFNSCEVLSEVALKGVNEISSAKYKNSLLNSAQPQASLPRSSDAYELGDGDENENEDEDEDDETGDDPIDPMNKRKVGASSAIEASQAALVDSHRRRVERERLLQEKRAQEKKDNCERMHRHLSQRHEKNSGSNPSVAVSSVSGQSDDPTSAKLPDVWTYEQDMALLLEIQNKRIRHLPAEERYLAILNNPILRDKFMEQIRKRALYYRDSMEEVCGSQDFVSSVV